MMHTLPRYLLGLSIVVGLLWPLTAAEPAKLDLSDFKTVDKATPTTIQAASGAPLGQAGYLGVNVELNPQGKLIVADVAADSPAAKAGLQKDDVIVKVADKEVNNADVFRELLLAHKPGDKVKLAILRQDKPQELTATLAATSRPMRNDRGAFPGGRVPLGTPDISGPTIGLRLDDGNEKEGAAVRRVVAGLPADKAGLKVGDVVLTLEGKAVVNETKLYEMVNAKKPGDVVTLTIQRDGKPQDVKVTLGGANSSTGGGGGPVNDALEPWKKPVYRLAVIGIDFPEAKHNAKIATKDWQEALFSANVFKNKNNATGQAVYGSMADYYQEVSCGKLRLEGKVFEPVEVKKKRAEYAPADSTGIRRPLLTEALEALQARDGKTALKDFDGLLFIYAGEGIARNAGNMFSPHRSSVPFDGKTWPYFFVPEGGSRMTNVSLLSHEFGKMLGLPDLSARENTPGTRGAGPWCAMSSQVANGKPQHLCAWAKEQLGWITPTLIDPTVPQKLILSPIEGSTKECYKVLLKLDGSEYLLLENRKRRGSEAPVQAVGGAGAAELLDLRQRKSFDEFLPGDGLLIWRVVNNKPTLEEAHGLEGPRAASQQVSAVPYPSSANNAFTPDTTPSSKSQLGGGLPVYITNIRRLPDGRITFAIGYEYH
jgi:M6 family metalloprotease-like protein